MVAARAHENDVRAATVAAAMRLFAAHGFEGTALQDIADAVGVTKPAVLHHFPSKEHVRQAVLDAILSHWNEALAAPAPRGHRRATTASTPSSASSIASSRATPIARASSRARCSTARRSCASCCAARCSRGSAPWPGTSAPARSAASTTPTSTRRRTSFTSCSSSSRPRRPPPVDARPRSRATRAPRYDRELARIARASLFLRADPHARIGPDRDAPKPNGDHGSRETPASARQRGKTMASFLTDNEDLLYYLNEGIDWTSLAEVTEYGWRAPDGFKNGKDAKQFYIEVATMMGELVAEQVAPARGEDRSRGHAPRERRGRREPLDEGGVRRDQRGRDAQALHPARARRPERADAPLLPLRRDVRARRPRVHEPLLVPRRHGDGDARLLGQRGHDDVRHASGQHPSTRFADEIGEIARGEAWGCMDITEPNAGSDMARAADPRRAGRRTATGSSPGRRSSSRRATASTTSSSRAPRTAKDPNDPFAGLGGLSMFLVHDVRRPARRDAQAPRHPRAHRGEARPPRRR